MQHSLLTRHVNRNTKDNVQCRPYVSLLWVKSSCTPTESTATDYRPTLKALRVGKAVDIKLAEVQQNSVQSLNSDHWLQPNGSSTL